MQGYHCSLSHQELLGNDGSTTSGKWNEYHVPDHIQHLELSAEAEDYLNNLLTVKATNGFSKEAFDAFLEFQAEYYPFPELVDVMKDWKHFAAAMHELSFGEADVFEYH